MNWGYKIMFVIIAFIAAMLGMVFYASRQTNEMVDQNYYEQELKYQNLIDAAHNLNAISNELLVKQSASGVEVQIPGALLADFKQGKIEFLRIDDQSKDINLDFSPDSNGLFLIDQSRFSPGLYKARIGWYSRAKQYYKEQELTIRG